MSRCSSGLRRVFTIRAHHGLMTEDSWQSMPQPEWSPVPAQPENPHGIKARLKRFFAPLAGIGAFLAKFGLILLKLKSVVFLGSAAVSIFAYAQLWGWKYAVGFVVLLLLHELGHVVALRLRGIHTGALVFVPLLGAFTSWSAVPRSAYEDAETALAGPVAGTVGALAVGYVAHQDGSGLLMSLAFTGLLLNLFNLAPVRPLDGGKITGLLYPWIWVVGIAGLLGYELYRPGAIALILLLLACYQLYHQTKDRDGTYARTAASVEPSQRTSISMAYIVLLGVILIGLHATYAQRHFA
jgi:Zn-dependent protease